MECKHCGSKNWGVTLVLEGNLTEKTTAILPAPRVRAKCNVCGNVAGAKQMAILRPALDRVLRPIQQAVA